MLAVRAEASGWDGVWFEDYLVHYAGDDPPTFDPWQVTDERLGELLALLSGEPVDGVTFRPPPVQRPRLPV